MESMSVRSGGPAAPPEQNVRQAVETAVWAPSVHNTQPWRFTRHGTRISLKADPDRRLDVADPDGREMLISCGAALFTLCLAIRELGYSPEVRLLPDPDRPLLLADVSIVGPTPSGEDVRRLFEQIRRRRTHRGAFGSEPVPAGLLAALKFDAEQEGAKIIMAVETNTKGALAALTQAAEHVQRLTPAHVSEAARWAPAPNSARPEGVHQDAYPQEAPRTEPHFPGRDFARGHGWGVPANAPGDAPQTPVTGAVAILTTDGDTPADWLQAGRALQRVLLRAATEDLAAAFHTQALEIPELRAFIRDRFCGGAHPQMLLRLGRPHSGFTSVRQPADLVDES